MKKLYIMSSSFILSPVEAIPPKLREFATELGYKEIEQDLEKTLLIIQKRTKNERWAHSPDIYANDVYLLLLWFYITRMFTNCSIKVRIINKQYVLENREKLVQKRKEFLREAVRIEEITYYEYGSKLFTKLLLGYLLPLLLQHMTFDEILIRGLNSSISLYIGWNERILYLPYERAISYLNIRRTHVTSIVADIVTTVNYQIPSEKEEVILFARSKYRKTKDKIIAENFTENFFSVLIKGFEPSEDEKRELEKLDGYFSPWNIKEKPKKRILEVM